MQAIRYKRHFLILIFAVTVLWLVMKAGDAVPAGDARFFLFFGGMGALHATSLVISLRDRTAVTLVRAVVFITLVAVLSAVAPFSFVVLMPFLNLLGDSLRLLFALAFASAFGASGYWLLLRWFWMKSLRPVSLITTALLCATATVLAWPGAGRLMPLTRDIGDLLPTVAWWAAFSLSLYWGDRQGSRWRISSNSASG